jgi:hypothetical protein
VRKLEKLELVLLQLLGVPVSKATHLVARSARGEAWLKMQVDPEDPPTLGDDGRLFIVVVNEDLGGFLEALELAGLDGEDVVAKPKAN